MVGSEVVCTMLDELYETDPITYEEIGRAIVEPAFPDTLHVRCMGHIAGRICVRVSIRGCTLVCFPADREQLEAHLGFWKDRGYLDANEVLAVIYLLRDMLGKGWV